MIMKLTTSMKALALVGPMLLTDNAVFADDGTEAWKMAWH